MRLRGPLGGALRLLDRHGLPRARRPPGPWTGRRRRLPELVAHSGQSALNRESAGGEQCLEWFTSGELG